MTDKMKHFSIEKLSDGLYRLKILAWKDGFATMEMHTMAITKETLNALMRSKGWSEVE